MGRNATRAAIAVGALGLLTSCYMRPEMPRRYEDQIPFLIDRGRIVNVVGVTSEKDTTFKPPFGEDWYSEDNLDAMLDRYPKLVLMVEAVDCQACVYTRPFLERYAGENPGKAAFTAAEVHYNPLNFPIITRYNIENTPAFVVFRDGRESRRLRFTRNYLEFKSQLDSLLAE